MSSDHAVTFTIREGYVEDAKMTCSAAPDARCRIRWARD